jgi:hypothetical protein
MAEIPKTYIVVNRVFSLMALSCYLAPMTDRKNDQYRPQETQQRFKAALRGARIAGHKSGHAGRKEDDSRGRPGTTETTE